MPEYFRNHGGVVFSSTINLYSYATLIDYGDATAPLGVNSLDYNLNVKYTKQDLVINGELDLIKAAAKFEGITEGIDLFLHSDAPPGCGLGSSSTMAVALLALLKKYRGQDLDKHQLAKDAITLERSILNVPGGWQDQFAAAYGGFKLYHFHSNGLVDVIPVNIDPYIVEELQYHCLLVFTGKTRLGKNIIADQIQNYAVPSIESALEKMKGLTYEMMTDLTAGDIMSFGIDLHEAFLLKKQMSSKITDIKIETLYNLAHENGAWGGKLLGAGGGGYLLICAPFTKKHKIAQILEEFGAEVVSFEFENQGVRTWEVGGHI